MAVEIVARTAPLARLVAQATADRLRVQCFASTPAGLVDRVTVNVAGAAVVPAGGAAELRLPAVVDVTTRPAVLAAPNVRPAVQTIAVTFVFSATAQIGPPPTAPGAAPGPLVVVRPDRVDGVPAPFRALVDPVFRALPPVVSPLAALFDTLGVPRPTTTATTITADEVAFRFDPGTAGLRLPPAVDHGVFVDGPAVAEAVQQRVYGSLGSASNFIFVPAAWRPTATGVPRVHLEPTFRVRVDPGPDIKVWAGVDAVLTLPPPWTALRVGATWSVHVLVGSGFGFIEGPAEDIAASVLEAKIDPATFGAVKDGARAFHFDLPVGTVPVAGFPARLVSVTGTPAGMTIGLGLSPAFRAIEPLALTVSPLSEPMRVIHCLRALPGPPPPLTLDNTLAVAMAKLERAGGVCDVEVLGPAELAGGVTSAYDAGEDVVRVDVRLGYRAAMAADDPLLVLVRTPGGVRLLDFGTAPDVVPLPDGTLPSGTDLVFNHCQYFPEAWPHRTAWGELFGEELVNTELFKRRRSRTRAGPASSPAPPASRWKWSR